MSSDTPPTPDADVPYPSTRLTEPQPLWPKLGPFQILDVLGEGGMGRVYRALDTNLGREVALKVMREEVAGRADARQRLLREARAAAKLTHDHIVQIFHVDEANGAPFIAMPLLKGESVQQRVRREGALPVAEVVRIGREVALGLAAAHQAGLVHRDIKPGNL